MDNIVKIGSIKLTEKEANDLYFSGKRYICSYRKVYQLNWCVNYAPRGGVYGTEIYYHQGDLPLTKRGRFLAVNAERVNQLIGHNLVKVG